MKAVASRILVAHGDAARARVNAKTLADEAFSSDVAASAEAAIAKAEVNDYDVIVTGAGLPDMGAYELVAALRDVGVAAPIIQSGGGGAGVYGADDEAAAYDAGADYYIPPSIRISDVFKDELPQPDEFQALVLSGMVRTAIRRYRGEMDQSASEAIPESVADGGTSGVRILIVQECQGWANWAEQALRGEGHFVFVTPLGEEGVELAAAYAFDLIYVDDAAIDMHGFEIMRQMRAAGVVAPIIFISALEHYWLKAFDRGADLYIELGFSRSVLLAQARQAVRRWRREETFIGYDEDSDEAEEVAA